MLCRMEIFVSFSRYVFFCYLTSLACICITHRLLPVLLEQSRKAAVVGAPWRQYMRVPCRRCLLVVGVPAILVTLTGASRSAVMLTLVPKNRSLSWKVILSF